MTPNNADTKIAVLEANMTNIAKDIADIKADIKAIVHQMGKQPTLEAEIIALKDEIQEIRKSSNLWKWLSPSLTFLFTTILVFLFMNYIERL
jgi:hypothetical protein